MKIIDIEDPAVRTQLEQMAANLRRLAGMMEANWSRGMAKKIEDFFLVGAKCMKTLDQDKYWTPDNFKKNT